MFTKKKQNQGFVGCLTTITYAKNGKYFWAPNMEMVERCAQIVFRPAKDAKGRFFNPDWFGKEFPNFVLLNPHVQRPFSW